MSLHMFVVEDESHAEWIGEFASRDEAYAEIRRLAKLRWDEVPNRCPCISWRTCGRSYYVIEFDTSFQPWRQLSAEAMLEVSAKETTWISDQVRFG